MLELIMLLQTQHRLSQNEEALASRALALINSGRVVLTGNFADAPTPLK